MNSTCELGRHAARALKPYSALQGLGGGLAGRGAGALERAADEDASARTKHEGVPRQPLLAATQTKGVVRKDKYENRTMLALKDLHLLKLVRVGDFVISLRSFQGGIEYAREQGIISPAYTILYPVNGTTTHI